MCVRTCVRACVGTESAVISFNVGKQLQLFQLKLFLISVLYFSQNESERKQRPRGSVHLAAAVISPSDEDSNTFTVNSATGDMFKLRAADARARHEWVSRIRSVAEMHTMAIAQVGIQVGHCSWYEKHVHIYRSCI